MAEGSSPGRDVDDVTDVPPLEDMSELINQVNKLRDELEVSSKSSTAEPGAESSTKYETLTTKTQNSSSQGQKSMQSAKTFGGFKKGFLNKCQATKGKPSSSSKPLRKDDIPVIKPKTPKERNRGMELPEVQDALKSDIPSLEKKDWITEDLLKKIEGNPSLAKLLMDPKFTAALSQVQADPMKAMAILSSNPEMQTALQEFSGILGEHFTALGKSAAGVTQTMTQEDIGLTERVTGRRQRPPVPSSAEDEAKMQEILSDPEVLKVLEDPQIQKLLTLMKANADAAQLEVRNATTETRAKIQKLVDVGLLGFAQ